MSEPTGPYWCPYCEAVILLDGEPATTQAEAYWHAYDHKDIAPYAHDVAQAFEKAQTVDAGQHVPESES